MGLMASYLFSNCSNNQLQDLNRRIETDTEVIMTSRSLMDDFLPKIELDKEKIRKIKTEIETKNLPCLSTKRSRFG